MTRSEKKAVIESMAEKFMNIDDLEGKSMTIELEVNALAPQDRQILFGQLSRIDRSKNVIALFVGDTYDEIDSASVNHSSEGQR